MCGDGPYRNPPGMSRSKDSPDRIPLRSLVASRPVRGSGLTGTIAHLEARKV